MAVQPLKAAEIRNGEKRLKAGRGAHLRVPPPMPGALEKGVPKDPARRYREPTQVPPGEKPKASRG